MLAIFAGICIKKVILSYNVILYVIAKHAIVANPPCPVFEL
jgi:hypothetical protein